MRNQRNFSKLPVSQRAGTKLNPSTSRPVMVKRGRREFRTGVIDLQQRILQIGTGPGGLGTLLAHKLGAIGLDPQEWKVAQQDADTLEVVDNNRNVCYSISVARAAREGEPYDLGAGERFGIPFTSFRKIEQANSANVETPRYQGPPSLFDLSAMGNSALEPGMR